MNSAPRPSTSCPLVILMWNNDALGQIRDDMVTKGIQPNAVTLKNPDFQMLAKAYGCAAEKPASLKALAQAIKRALWPPTAPRSSK